MSSNLEIIVGTYEEFLLGYKLEAKDDKPTLLQSFADKSHAGALKCLAVHAHWIASGATDDRIFIYDMRQRKQTQILLSHSGSINALAFTPDGTHLLSAAEDGLMIATRLSNWLADATWTKAHNGAAVTHISVHPSGKLALSLGSDMIMRTWNLVKGRVAYKTNLKSKSQVGLMPNCLSWSPCGEYFILTGQRITELWSIKTADVLRSQQTNSKPICVCWISSETCLIGLENGKIQWLQLQDDAEKFTEAHASRVKDMALLCQNLVSISSAGEMKLWLLEESKGKLKELASLNIGCRPTCVALLDLQQFANDNAVTTQNKVTTKAAATQNDANAPQKEQQSANRGIVTIEYENDAAADSSDEQSAAFDDDKAADEENEQDSVAADDDDDDEVNDMTSSNSEEEEEDSAESSAEETKPGKRKQQSKIAAARPLKKTRKNK